MLLSRGGSVHSLAEAGGSEHRGLRGRVLRGHGGGPTADHNIGGAASPVLPEAALVPSAERVRRSAATLVER